MLRLSRSVAAVLTLWAAIAGRTAAEDPSGLEAAGAIQEAVVQAIAGAEPSVVAIARVHKQQPGEALEIESRPDAFGGQPVPVNAPQPTDPDFIPTQYGTGVVLDAQGLILTAYHVLGEESEYYVRTHDRKTYRAWVKAADPRSDLAVLAIEATDLRPMRLGDATSLRKGQFVIALGNPYAIARDGQVSASWGIVSNLARKAPPDANPSAASGKTTLHHFGTLIQTDAKLNLGTSGGALLNLQGEMVGLTLALVAAAGYETAAGYAIPVDPTFHRVVETLKAGREVEYGFLGIQPVELSQTEILAGKQGVRVDRVVPGTPAARAGLEPNDVVTAVGGRPVYEPDGFVLEVGRLPVEAVTRLGLLRAGRPRSIHVTLAKYPVRGKKIFTMPAPEWRGMRVDYPTAVVDSDPQAQAGVAFFSEGVVVAEVAEGTPAWDAGLRRGMRIARVGRTAVRTPKEFLAAAEKLSGAADLQMAEDPDHPVRTVQPGP